MSFDGGWLDAIDPVCPAASLAEASAIGFTFSASRGAAIINGIRHYRYRTLILREKPSVS